MRRKITGRRLPRDAGRHAPSLWSFWVTAPLTVLLAGAASWLIFLGIQGLATSDDPSVKILDLVKTTLTIAGFVAAVIAGVYAYRKQRLTEGDAHRADAQLLGDRYTAAAEQLGHEGPAVRLAGVYAMSQIADDWYARRQMCIDVLCAYLRMPYEPDPSSPAYRTGERNVRATIIRVIRDHLQDEDTDDSWCGYNLDFTGATFDHLSFSNTTLHFDESRFHNSHLYFVDTRFSCCTVDLDDCTFKGSVAEFNQSGISSTFINFNRSSFDNETTVDLSNTTWNNSRLSLFKLKPQGVNFKFDKIKLSTDTVLVGPLDADPAGLKP